MQELEKNVNQGKRAEAARRIPVGSRWRHYKGGLYVIVDVACLESDPETILVIYYSVSRSFVWARPLANFEEDVVIGTARHPRFSRSTPPSLPPDEKAKRRK